MDHIPTWRDEQDGYWFYRDEKMHKLLENKYSDRKKFAEEAEKKRQAVEKMKDDNPLYHRASVSAEMAQIRFEMAYLVDRNRQLAEYIEGIEYLHQRVGIVEGAYGHLKLLFETCKIQATLCNNKPAKEKP